MWFDSYSSLVNSPRHYLHVWKQENLLKLELWRRCQETWRSLAKVGTQLRVFRQKHIQCNKHNNLLMLYIKRVAFNLPTQRGHCSAILMEQSLVIRIEPWFLILHVYWQSVTWYYLQGRCFFFKNTKIFIISLSIFSVGLKGNYAFECSGPYGQHFTLAAVE